MTDLTILEATERERARARRHLESKLDGLCRRNGLDPWEAWRKPHHLRRIDAQVAMHAQLRRDLAKIARPTTDGLGSPFVYPHPVTVPDLVADESVPPGEAWIRDDAGRILAKIRGLGS